RHAHRDDVRRRPRQPPHLRRPRVDDARQERRVEGDALRLPAGLHDHSHMIPNRLAVVAAAFLLVLGGCGQASISKEHAAGVIQSSPGFKRAKVAYVSRVIAIPADGIEEGTKAIREGQALDLTQIAAIDPVIAVLRARDQIGIEEFVSPVPSSIVLPPKRDTLDSAAKVDSVKRDSVKLDSARKVEQPLDSAVKKPPKPVKLGPTTSPPPVPPLAQIWVHTLRVT